MNLTGPTGCGWGQPCQSGPLPGTWCLGIFILAVLIIAILIIRNGRESRDDEDDHASREGPRHYHFDQNDRIVKYWEDEPGDRHD